MKKLTRKIRRDAVLKKLEGPVRAQIAEWLEADGPESCAQSIFSQLNISHKGKPVSPAMIYEALAFWRTQATLDAAFAEADAQEELMKRFRPEDPQLARAFGEFVLLQKANRTEDKDLFTAATMAQDMRRGLDQKDQQIALKQKQVEQKNEELKLAQKRFQRDTCELFLEWFDKEQAKSIASGSGTNAEKIDQLGQAMFGEDWNA